MSDDVEQPPLTKHRVNIYRDDDLFAYWAECNCKNWHTKPMYSTPKAARVASKDHLDLVR